MTEPAFDVVAYEPRWTDQILDLWALVQGKRMSRERFNWYFERNPTGIVNIHMALSGGRVIGVVSHNALRMNVDGRDELVSMQMNADTHPDFRGRGVFSTLTRAAARYAEEAGVTLMMSVTNRESTPIFLGRLGWRPLPGLRIFARILHPLSFLAQFAGCGSAAAGSRPSGRAEDALTPVVGKAGLIAKDRLSLARIDRFGPWVDDVWDSVRPKMPRAAMRSADYLNWRFAEKPDSEYVCFAVLADVDSVGYIVTGHTTKRNTRFCHVAHAMLHPEHAAAYRRIRTAALTATGRGSVAALDTTAPGECRSAGGGFFLTPKRLNLIYRPMTGGVTAETVEGGSWRLQLGDLDFF